MCAERHAHQPAGSAAIDAADERDTLVIVADQLRAAAQQQRGGIVKQFRRDHDGGGFVVEVADQWLRALVRCGLEVKGSKHGPSSASCS